VTIHNGPGSGNRPSKNSGNVYVVALIGAAATIIAAFITGAFTGHSVGLGPGARPTVTATVTVQPTAPGTGGGGGTPSTNSNPTPYKLTYPRTNLTLSGVPGDQGNGSCGVGAYVNISIPSVNPSNGDDDVLLQSNCDMKHVSLSPENGIVSLQGSDSPNDCLHATTTAPITQGETMVMGDSICVESDNGSYVAYLKWVGLTSDYSAKFIIDGWTRS
jgi:hypothetical protein